MDHNTLSGPFESVGAAGSSPGAQQIWTIPDYGPAGPSRPPGLFRVSATRASRASRCDPFGGGRAKAFSPRPPRVVGDGGGATPVRDAHADPDETPNPSPRPAGPGPTRRRRLSTVMVMFASLLGRFSWAPVRRQSAR